MQDDRSVITEKKGLVWIADIDGEITIPLITGRSYVGFKLPDRKLMDRFKVEFVPWGPIFIDIAHEALDFYRCYDMADGNPYTTVECLPISAGRYATLQLVIYGPFKAGDRIPVEYTAKYRPWGPAGSPNL